MRWYRPPGAEPLLLIGGADHKTGQRDARQQPFDALEAWARRTFAGLGPVVLHWSGQVIEPVDSLAFVGRDIGARDVYVVTGASGNGITHGTLAAALIPALIAGRRHRWETIYAPDRHRFNRDWLHENANVAWQYTDWVAPAEHVTLEAIPAGEGAVLRRGMHRYAVSRDQSGHLHAFSARCTHLGCAVRWNRHERSWDCPCHGSRFDAHAGAVLNGPASAALERVPLDLLAPSSARRSAA